MSAYIGVFVLVITLVAIGYRPPEQLNSATATSNGVPTDKNAVAVPTTDEVQAVSMAATIASTVNLPVATNVSNLSQSLVAQSAIAQSDAGTVAKPQIIDPSTKQRTVTTYVAKAGDTVEKIAGKYNISTQTVRWANDLTSDALSPGTKLKVLPIDGILYKVEKGDTVASIAKKYQASPERIRLYNDLDLTRTLKVGSKIIIPNGVLPSVERPGYTEPVNSYYGGSVSSGVNNYYNASAGNRYVGGECTWYAYERRAELGEKVGSFWGNAATWGYYARLAGYRVDLSPSAGAVMQNGGGYYGHVAVVESVVPGKSVTVSEMNYGAYGMNRGRITSRTLSWSDATSGYYNFIH